MAYITESISNWWSRLTGGTGILPVANGGSGSSNNMGLSTLTGIPKGDGAGTFTAASDGTDYLSPTTGVKSQAMPGTVQATNGFNMAGVGKMGGAHIGPAPAIINAGFAGTVGSVGTTVTFSSAADAILAGYNASNTSYGIGCTIIAGGQTRYIMSWTNATTCVVDTAPSPVWAATAITSVQLPIAVFVNSAGVLQGWITAAGLVYFVGQIKTGSLSGYYGYLDIVSNTLRIYGNGGVSIAPGSNTDIALTTAGTGKTTVSGGFLGINTTTPVFRTDVNGALYSRVRYGRVMFDDAPVGTQLESTPSAGMVTTAGTNYAAPNVTIQSGGVQATTAAADDDSVTILHAIPLNTSQNPKVSFRFKVDSVTNAYVAVGLTTAAFADKGTLPDNCALIGMDADNGHTFGAARLVLTTKDDGAAVDYDDLGSNMASNTWVWGVIDLTDPDQPRVWINGTEIAAASITGTVKDATAFYLYFHVQNLAGGAHTLTAICDHWQQDHP